MVGLKFLFELTTGCVLIDEIEAIELLESFLLEPLFAVANWNGLG
jgi:hypothetical protein